MSDLSSLEGLDRLAAVHVIGLLLVHTNHETTDISRIAAQVVTGIGFLGAGCIMQSGDHVTGLTSAATIWVSAAIGIVAGAGFPVMAGRSSSSQRSSRSAKSRSAGSKNIRIDGSTSFSPNTRRR